MKSIQLTYNDGSQLVSRNFDVVVLWKDYYKEETSYTGIDWKQGKIVHAVYDRWNIYFGNLSEADQDFLIEWEKHEIEADTKMTYNSTDYGPLIIQRLDIKPNKGILRFILQEPNP